MIFLPIVILPLVYFILAVKNDRKYSRQVVLGGLTTFLASYLVVAFFFGDIAVNNYFYNDPAAREWMAG